jgi:hypothetical protein
LKFITIVFSIFVVCAQSFADSGWYGVKVVCRPNTFQIEGTDNAEEQQTKETLVFSGFGTTKSAQCSIAGHNLNATLVLPAEQGCAGTRVTLKIDGQLLFRDAPLDYCGQTLSSINIESVHRDPKAYQLRLCGNYAGSGGNLPNFEGCFAVHSAHIEKLAKPLAMWPIDSLREVFEKPIENLALEELFGRDGFHAAKDIDEKIDPDCKQRKLIASHKIDLPGSVVRELYPFRSIEIDRCGRRVSYLVQAVIWQFGERHELHFKIIEHFMERNDLLRLMANRSGLHCGSNATIASLGKEGSFETFGVTCDSVRVAFKCELKKVIEYENDTLALLKAPCTRIYVR